tara:strand:+ start:920 stop:1957 length:1038 start_codon:yes stop_codon:yes gene_type:complete
MLLKGFGDILANVMTVNPALADLPTASSILDTSNYTFQAVTFGKDAQGFTNHSHVISSTQYVNGVEASGASSYDSGIFTVINYGSDLAEGASSYVTSAYYLEFSSTYNSIPNDPSPLDTRLERGSTMSTNLSSYQYASALPDLGHYANPAIDSQLSSIWNKVGGFPPSGVSEYYFYDNTSSFSFSGEVSSYFNSNGLMDKNGYLTFNPKPVLDLADRGTEASGGAILVSSTPLSPSKGKISVSIVVQSGDACTLAAFGGVKHIGVYCLDLTDMLASGLLPPYSWDALNNTRKYKLVATVTTLEDIIYHRDFVALGYSGFQTVVNENVGTGFTYGGPNINLTFDFK